MTLRTLNYGNYGIFLIMGHAGFCPSNRRAWLVNQRFATSEEEPKSRNPTALNTAKMVLEVMVPYPKTPCTHIVGT